MSPDQTYIVVINDFYAYQITMDMNEQNKVIAEAIKLHTTHTQIDAADKVVSSIRVCVKM